jgi:hypothetical protein
MSILAIIGSTNWNAVEDELYGPPRAIVTSTPYKIPLEYLGMLAGILTIWILGANNQCNFHETQEQTGKNNRSI